MAKSKKKWQVKAKAPAGFFESFPEVEPLVLQLLYNRNLRTAEQIEEFLNPDYLQDSHDPYLFTDALRAVDRVLKARQLKEKVVVYGDYDADGVCSSAIIISLLKELGIEHDIYIPYRDIEGYGLNLPAVQKIIKQGAKVLITVDCGITNQTEVEYLQQHGVDVVLTDHHTPPPNLPRAFALLNPKISSEKYPFVDLAGAGVAFKFVQAMVKRLKEQKDPVLPEGWEKWLLDLVAIATVADMCPLIGENRTFVRWGLVVLHKTRRKGLQELVSLMGSELTKLNTEAVSWQIAPRLNAAGRLNHASTAYELLLTEKTETAKKLANELNQTNQERQKVTDVITEEAKEQLGVVGDRQKILTVVKDDWPLGLVGLIAGRISDEHHRPVLAACRNGEGKYTGSGRSIPGFNLIFAINDCQQFLEHAGGHSQAAGFTAASLDKLQEFYTAISQLANQQIKTEQLVAIVEAESEVKLAEINWQLWEQIEKFSPFGFQNEHPIFLTRGLKIEGLQLLGKAQQHLKLMVSQGVGKIHKTIGFSLAKENIDLRVGDKIDLLFELGVNEWNGNRELQLKIIDLKKI